MSASRKTDNFNLPLYNADDATSWLVDFNGAMSDIDRHLKTLTDNVTTDGADIDNLEKGVENLNKSVSQLTDSVIKVQENGKSNSSAITLLQTHDNEQDTRLTALESDVSNATNKLEDVSNKVDSVTEKETALETSLKLSIVANTPLNNVSIKNMADMSNKGHTIDGSITTYENSILRSAILTMSISTIGSVEIPYYSITTGGTFGDGILPNTVIGIVEIRKNNKNLAVKSNVYLTTTSYLTAEFETSEALSGNETITIRVQGLKSEV